MAATYDVVTQYPGVQTLGGSQTRDVIFVGIQTKPSGIYVEFPINKASYKSTSVATAAAAWAKIAEAINAEPFVTDVQWTQIVTAGGQLVNGWVITVESSSGNSAGQLTVANRDLAANYDAAPIAALHKELNAAEGL